MVSFTLILYVKIFSSTLKINFEKGYAWVFYLVDRHLISYE